MIKGSMLIVMGITQVTDTKTWETDVITSDKPVFVDFWAEWCGPCRMVGPVVEELAGDYDGKVNFVKVNVDQAGELACLLYTSPSPRDRTRSRMPSSA